MKFFTLFIIVTALLFINIDNVHAQSFSTNGKDFWLGFMSNNNTAGTSLDLYISSTTATSGTVSVPLAGWSNTFNTVPGTVTIVNVPVTYMASGSENIESKGIHVVSNDSISLFAMNYKNASFDAALILPTPTLGDDYYVMAYEGLSTSSYPSECLITSAQDNATIEITPSVKTKAGKAAGVPFTIVLNKGEVYQIQGYSNYDLTGTRVRSYSGAPIAVYGGGVCVNVGGCTYCDHIYEQMYPITTWGKSFVLVPLKTRNEDVYRVIASENGTVVTINGSSNITLNAGKYYEFKVQQAAQTVEATCPIAVAQYSEGKSCDGIAGDPFIIMLSPNDQTLSKATFVEINTSMIDKYYINIVAQTANTSLVKLDGTSIASSFATVPANTLYSYAQITSTAGAHTLETDSGFIAYVYGFGTAESYGYAAGASLKNLTSFNIIINADTTEYTLFNDTICPGESINFEGTSASNILGWTWYYGDGDSTIGKTASHTYNQEGDYDLQLVILKDNGCSVVTDTLNAKLTVKGPSISFIAIDENCSQADGMAIAQLSDSTITATYSWDTNPVQTNDTASGLAAGDYVVTVNYGVCSATDTVSIINITSFTIELDSVDETCSLSNGMAYVTTSASGAYSYNWNTNPVQISDTAYNLTAGTYIVSVDDGTCLVKDSILISNTEPPILVLNSIDETCNLSNGSAIVQLSGGTPPYTISWNTNPVQNTDTAMLLSTGTYVITVTDSLCTIIDSVDVNGAPVLVSSNFSFDQELGDAGKTIANFINLASGADSVLWDFGDGSTSKETNPAHIYADTGMYAVTLIVYDPNGCADTLIQYIYIEEPYSFFIPNSFTPNGDGLNDGFSGNGVGIATYSMLIYDRWGNKIYETNDLSQTWNGKMKDKDELVQDGVYIYKISVQDVLGNNYVYRGSVAVIR